MEWGSSGYELNAKYTLGPWLVAHNKCHFFFYKYTHNIVRNILVVLFWMLKTWCRKTKAPG